MTPSEFTDTVMQTQAQRGILEFSYRYPGMYMFHAHNTEFAELGWTGMFEVTE
jgi:FtsP/CotA-like multicopper oxidase with cupredoxin domain